MTSLAEAALAIQPDEVYKLAEQLLEKAHLYCRSYRAMCNKYTCGITFRKIGCMQFTKV